MKIKTTNRENLIINALRETEEKRALQIPEGYAEIALSSKGKLGAPELFHIRNFKVGEVMSLAQTKESDLSQRLTSILNEMILEDVDVKDWHESEVLETMVYVYMIFFQPILKDVYFPVNQEDLNYLESQGRTDEAQYIREGKQKPLVEINIADGVTTYDLPDNFKKTLRIKNPDTGFYCDFSYIKYGDKLVVQEFLDRYFAEQEARFTDIIQRINYNNNVIRNRKNNPLVKTLPIDPVEEAEYREYRDERIKMISEVTQYVSIVNYNGRDVSDLPLWEKYKLLSEDPRVDYNMFQILEEKRGTQEFGIKPLVKMTNPFTKEPCERRLAFRLSVILQAIIFSRSNRYVCSSSDED